MLAGDLVVEDAGGLALLVLVDLDVVGLHVHLVHRGLGHDRGALDGEVVEHLLRPVDLGRAGLQQVLRRQQALGDLLGDDQDAVDAGVDVLVGAGQLAVALVAHAVLAAAGDRGAQDDLAAHGQVVAGCLLGVDQPPVLVLFVLEGDVAADETLGVVLGQDEGLDAVDRAAVFEVRVDDVVRHQQDQLAGQVARGLDLLVVRGQRLAGADRVDVEVLHAAQAAQEAGVDRLGDELAVHQARLNADVDKRLAHLVLVDRGAAAQEAAEFAGHRLQTRQDLGAGSIRRLLDVAQLALGGHPVQELHDGRVGLAGVQQSADGHAGAHAAGDGTRQLGEVVRGGSCRKAERLGINAAVQRLNGGVQVALDGTGIEGGAHKALGNGSDASRPVRVQQSQADQRATYGHQLGACPAVNHDLVATAAIFTERVLVKFLDGTGVQLLVAEKCCH